MTAEITDDCRGGWMGAFSPLCNYSFFFFFSPPDFQSSFSLMFPDDNSQEADKKKATHTRIQFASGTFPLLAGMQVPLLL